MHPPARALSASSRRNKGRMVRGHAGRAGPATGSRPGFFNIHRAGCSFFGFVIACVSGRRDDGPVIATSPRTAASTAQSPAPDARRQICEKRKIGNTLRIAGTHAAWRWAARAVRAGQVSQMWQPNECIQSVPPSVRLRVCACSVKFRSETGPPHVRAGVPIAERDTISSSGPSCVGVSQRERCRH